MFKRALLAASIGLIAATSHAETLLSEDFADITKLNGWILTNQSTPAGDHGWGQGFIDVFTAQAGADNSYIFGDFGNASAGGTLANWLITPTFATDKTVQISFYARAAGDPAYSDALTWGFNTSGSGDTAAFTMGPVMTINGGQWHQYTVTLNAQGAGTFARFAIEYTGAADTSNYVGIDSMTINAVPEPGTVALAGLGLLALGFAARRSRKQMAAVALAGAAAALPLAAQAAEESTAADSAVSSTDSQIVVRDAATGRLRAATGEEAKALVQARTGHAQGQLLQLAQRRHATGAVGVRLNDNFMSHSVVVRQPDGRLTEYCFSTAEEAEAAVKNAQPVAAAQSNPLPTE